MLKAILITALILFLLMIVLICYAACVAAGRADREMEAYLEEREYMEKTSSLPDGKEV